MRPRIVFRTHYQVDEPAYMEFLIKLCTSPVQSTYRELVAQKLAREIKTRGGKLNEDAGRYGADLAEDLGLITSNNVWTDKGHLVDLIASINYGTLEEQLKLNLAEKLLYFRVFLEADGAALLFLGRKLVECRAVANSEATWNALAKEMFVEIYSNYLRLTNSTSERVELRRMVNRINTQGYKGNSGEHKIFVHLHTLYRLGLIIRPENGRSRAYQLPDNAQGKPRGLEILLNEVPDMLSLEKVINTHRWIEIATKVFQIDRIHSPVGTAYPNTEKVLSLVMPYYEQIMSTGTPMCPLSTIIEAILIDQLANKSLLLSYNDAMSMIVAAQKERPKDIRFHVDRRGRPAFLKLSEDIVEACFEQVTA